MKNAFLMSIISLAVIVDAMKNYVLGAPINGIGILLGLVIVLYFTGAFQRKNDD